MEFRCSVSHRHGSVGHAPNTPDGEKALNHTQSSPSKVWRSNRGSVGGWKGNLRGRDGTERNGKSYGCASGAEGNMDC